MSAQRGTWLAPAPRRTYRRHGSTEQLMSWRVPRLSQATHALLALLVAVVVTCAGSVGFAALPISTSLVVLLVIVWACIVTTSLYAYAEQVIRR